MFAMDAFLNLPNVMSRFTSRDDLRLDQTTCNMMQAAMISNLPKVAGCSFLPPGDSSTAGNEQDFTRKWPNNPENGVSHILNGLCNEVDTFTKAKAHSADAVFQAEGMCKTKRALMFQVMMGYHRLEDVAIKAFSSKDRQKLASFCSQYFVATASDAVDWFGVMCTDISWIRSFMAQCPATTFIMAAFVNSAAPSINLTDSGAVQIAPLIRHFNDSGPCATIAPPTSTQRMVEPIRNMLIDRTAFPPTTTATRLPMPSTSSNSESGPSSSSSSHVKRKVTTYRRGQAIPNVPKTPGLKALQSLRASTAPFPRPGKPRSFKKMASDRSICLKVDASSAISARRATRSRTGKRILSPVPLSPTLTQLSMAEPLQINRAAVTLPPPPVSAYKQTAQFVKPSLQANVPTRESLMSETDSLIESPIEQSQSSCSRSNPVVNIRRLPDSVTRLFAKKRLDSGLGAEVKSAKPVRQVSQEKAKNEQVSSPPNVNTRKLGLSYSHGAFPANNSSKIDLTRASSDDEWTPTHMEIVDATTKPAPLKIIYSSPDPVTDSDDESVQNSRPSIKRLPRAPRVGTQIVAGSTTTDQTVAPIPSPSTKTFTTLVTSKIHPPALPNSTTAPFLRLDPDIFTSSNSPQFEVTPIEIRPTPLTTPPSASFQPSPCKMDTNSDEHEESFWAILGDFVPPPMILPGASTLSTDNIKRDLEQSSLTYVHTQRDSSTIDTYDQILRNFQLATTVTSAPQAPSPESMLSMADPLFLQTTSLDSTMSALSTEPVEVTYHQSFANTDLSALLDVQGTVEY